MVASRRDKVLDRLKKILALSTSSNVNEAANAAAAAQKLMLEHKLSESDVSDTQEGQMFELSMGAAGFSARWKFILVTAVARSFSCEAVGLRVGQRRKVRIVGRRGDVEISARVFRHLHSEIDRLAKIEIESIDWGVRDVLFGSLGLEAGQDPVRYLESFRRGAVAAVVAKFRTCGEPSVASDSRALAISSRDRDRVRGYVGSRFSDTRKPGFDEDARVDDLAFVRGYEQAQAIVPPGDVRTSTPGGEPDVVRKGEAGRSNPWDLAPGSPAEVFVKQEARPAVDVVVTHAGSVPVGLDDRADVPVADGPGGEDGEHGGSARRSTWNAESFFIGLKRWWDAKD